MLLFPAVSQIIQDQAEAGSKTEAESANPSMDQTEDWKHHQVIFDKKKKSKNSIIASIIMTFHFHILKLV